MPRWTQILKAIPKEDHPMAAEAWNTEFLDQMRVTGDPLADDTITTLFEMGGHEVTLVNELMRALIRRDQVAAADLPDVVKSFLNESAALPDWADAAKLRIGEALFREYGLIAFSLLGCASLPECYAAGDAAGVLWLTQKLEAHVERRILETSQMIIDVMSRGGLSPDGKGVRAAQKVRLMHAAVRHLVLTDPVAGAKRSSPTQFDEVLVDHPWKMKEWGLPINQSVMAGTLLTFSYVILRGLRTFDVKLTQEQEEGYLHTWNVVGHIMGVNDRFLQTAMTYDGAEKLFTTILDRNRSQSPEAQAMTHAVTRFMVNKIKKTIPVSRVLPLNHVPKTLIMDLVSPETAETLGIKLDVMDRLGQVVFAQFMKIVGIVEKDIYGELSPAHRRAEWLFRKMASQMWGLPRGAERELFFIPTELADGWNLQLASKVSTESSTAR
jgi:hypothetical protein